MSGLLFIVLGFLKPAWPWIAGAFGVFFLIDVLNGVRLARLHPLAGANEGPSAVKSVASLAMWSALIRIGGLVIGLLLSFGWRALANVSF